MLTKGVQQLFSERWEQEGFQNVERLTMDEQCAELREIDVKKLYSGVARCRATVHGATVKKWPPLTPPLQQRDDSLTAETQHPTLHLDARLCQ